jgi:serine/threonine protein kinase
MADIEQYEPLWGTWRVESLLGKGGFGKVYKVKKEEFGKSYYSAVKILSIPQSETELRQARSEGLDETSVRSYFHTFVMDILQEVDLMSAFRGNSNFVSLEDHKVIEKENEIGWDILIRMELLSSLPEYATEHPLTPDDVVKLGIHICRALELCALRKIIHRDIKPDNIFVSQYGEYKLGDFGVARQIERTLSGLSKKGTENYMAPEVFRGEEYGASVDLYSLGIVMYRYLNRNRLPFLPAFPKPVMPRDRDEARQRRMKGEALPPIEDIDPALNEIVLKACAFDRGARFGGAAEMKEALEALAESGNYTPVPLPSPLPLPSNPLPVPARPISAQPEEYGPKRPERRPAGDSEETEGEKTEGVFANRFETEKTVGAEGDESEKPRAETPPAVAGKLAVLSGSLFGLLGLSRLTGGFGVPAVLFFLLCALCAAQCALRFRSKYMNAGFLSALVCYLSYSFFFAFGIFDYSFFIMACGLSVLLAARAENRRLGGLFCRGLAACSAVAGVLTIRSIYGIYEGTYHAYVSGSIAIPFLLLLIASAGVALTRNEHTPAADCAAIGLIVSQAFPLAAFVLHGISSLGGVSPGGGTLFYMASANFLRVSSGSFLWRADWFFAGLTVQLILQCLAFGLFFALALAQTTPGVFTRVFDKENRKKSLLSAAAFTAATVVLTKIISLIPGLL